MLDPVGYVERKRWRLFRKHLETHPPEGWQVFAPVGMGYENPPSIYKLYLKPKPTLPWWLIRSSCPGQLKGLTDKVIAQKAATLPEGMRCISGRGLAVLAPPVVCHPGRGALVEALRLIQETLAR